MAETREEVDERSGNMAALEVESHLRLARHKTIRDRVFGQPIPAVVNMNAIRSDEEAAAIVSTVTVQREVHIRELNSLLELLVKLENSLNHGVRYPPSAVHKAKSA